MKHRLRMLMVCATLCAATAPAQAEGGDASTDVKDAERYGVEAYKAYEKKQYAEAVSLYLKAYDSVPSAVVLYNIAKIYDNKLKDRQLAMTFYRRYVADPQAKPDLVKTANERLSALRELEAAANDVPPPDTDAPTKTKSIDPSAAGSGPENSDAQPASGDSSSQSSGLTGIQIGGLVVGGVGLVGLGLGTIFGLGATSDNDDAKSLCDGNACTTQAGVDAVNSASDKAAVSTVGFVAGGGLLLTGVVMFLVGGSDDPKADKMARLRVAPAAGPSTFGFSVSGAW